MKKKDAILAMMILLFLMILIPMASSCFNPADSFASEAILNKPGIKYNLGLFLKGRNFLYENDKYIFQSQYNNKIAAILSESAEICKTNCLSLQLQIPVEEENAEFPYFSIISSVTKKKNDITDINHNGWQIFTGIESSEFRKGQISILVNSINNKHDIVIEINQELDDCAKCDGKCIESSYKNVCISKETSDDIEDILKYAGLIEKFDNLFMNFRSVGGKRILSDLKPAIDKRIDWEEAMRQELVWLKNNGVVNIENKDIENIAMLSEAGKAGNSKIVYSEEDGKWKYYYETPNPEFAKEINCEEFPSSKLPKNPLDFKGIMIPTYYLVPIVSVLSLALTFLILFIIARAIMKKRLKNKGKMR